MTDDIDEAKALVERHEGSPSLLVGPEGDYKRAALEADAPALLEACRTLLAERDTYKTRLQESYARLDALAKAANEIEKYIAEREADKAEIGRLREVLKATLSYERARAYLAGYRDCTCINHSREMERAYEAGECPHQRARAALRTLIERGYRKAGEG